MANTSLTDVDLLSHGMSRATFESNRENNRLLFAGSGFVEWGRAASIPINEGMWEHIHVAYPNVFFIGNSNSNGDNNTNSTSKTPYINVDGVMIHMRDVNFSAQENRITLNAAPDGTQTYDSSTGAFADHVDPATAFAAETGTNKVVLSRTDLVGLEVWTEKLVTNDVVYPLGNVQIGTALYRGITLVDTLMPLSYSGNYIVGYGAQWSSLTDAQKRVFLHDEENNIFYDEQGEFYQVRYRVRSIDGVNNDWTELDSFTDYGIENAVYTGEPVPGTPTFLRLQGKKSSADPLGNNNGELALTYKHLSSMNIPTVGAFGNNLPTLTDYDACYFMPICLVSRRNMGAYHPDYNPNGVAVFHQTGIRAWKWWQDFSTWKTVSSTVDCFTGMSNVASGTASVGMIESGAVYLGRPDSKYYDVIYATDIKDLRMSARKVTDYKRLLDLYWNKALDGTLRGWGNNTRMKTIAATVTVSSVAVYDPNNAGGDINFATSASTYTRGAATNVLGGLEATAWVLTGDNNEVMVIPIRSTTGGNSVYWPYSSNRAYLYSVGRLNNPTAEFNAKFPIGTILSVGAVVQDNVSLGDTFLACDVIGDPARFPARWISEGLPGTLIARPTGNSQEFIFSKKVVGGPPVSVVLSIDNGVTWSDNTANWVAAYDDTKNGRTGNVAVAQIMLIYYNAKAPVFIDEVTPDSVQGLGRVSHINSWPVNNGGSLPTEAFGVHSAGAINVAVPIVEQETQGTQINSIVQLSYSGVSGTASNGAGKFLSVLASSSGKAALAVKYNQIIVGTDSPAAMTIVDDRQNLDVDLNSAKISVGSMSIKLPFFINTGE